MSQADRTVREGELIAVYGLLRAGQSGFERFGLAHAFKPVGSCRIAGRLYDFGRYPALVAGAGEVRGEMFEVRDASVIAELDAYEDYWPNDPGRSRYERVRAQLIEPDRKAWVYLWIKALTGARFIESGDWFNR
ncbi:MAG: gamma-glutamylcyclotransferase family protein [Pseudomonadota bacterium]